jgi:hypothetical protein
VDVDDGRLMLQVWPCGAVQHGRIACKSRRCVGMQFRLFDSREGWVSDAKERLLVRDENVVAAGFPTCGTCFCNLLTYMARMAACVAA